MLTRFLFGECAICGGLPRCIHHLAMSSSPKLPFSLEPGPQRDEILTGTELEGLNHVAKFVVEHYAPLRVNFWSETIKEFRPQLPMWVASPRVSWLRTARCLLAFACEHISYDDLVRFTIVHYLPQLCIMRLNVGVFLCRRLAKDRDLWIFIINAILCHVRRHVQNTFVNLRARLPADDHDPKTAIVAETRENLLVMHHVVKRCASVLLLYIADIYDMPKAEDIFWPVDETRYTDLIRLMEELSIWARSIELQRGLECMYSLDEFARTMDRVFELLFKKQQEQKCFRIEGPNQSLEVTDYCIVRALLQLARQLRE